MKESISKGRAVISEQDEFTRLSHFNKTSRMNIDAAKISADGRN